MALSLRPALPADVGVPVSGQFICTYVVFDWLYVILHLVYSDLESPCLAPVCKP